MKTTLARSMASTLFYATMLASPLSAFAQESLISNPVDGIKSQAADTMKQVAPAAPQRIINSVDDIKTEAVGAVKQTAPSIPQGVTNPANSLKEEAADTVKQATPAIPKNPLGNMEANVKNAAADTIKNAKDQGAEGVQTEAKAVHKKAYKKLKLENKKAH